MGYLWWFGASCWNKCGSALNPCFALLRCEGQRPPSPAGSLVNGMVRDTYAPCRGRCPHRPAHRTIVHGVVGVGRFYRTCPVGVDVYIDPHTAPSNVALWGTAPTPHHRSWHFRYYRTRPVGADAHIGPHTAPSNFRTAWYGFALVYRASLLHTAGTMWASSPTNTYELPT